MLSGVLEIGKARIQEAWMEVQLLVTSHQLCDCLITASLGLVLKGKESAASCQPNTPCPSNDRSTRSAEGLAGWPWLWWPCYKSTTCFMSHLPLLSPLPQPVTIKGPSHSSSQKTGPVPHKMAMSTISPPTLIFWFQIMAKGLL